MQRSKRRMLADLVMVAVAMGILYATLLYKPDGSGGPAGLDKVFHAAAFFILVMPGAMVHRWAILWLVPLALAFGALIEVVQPYVGRSRELVDLYADAGGAVAGYVLGTAWRIWRVRRRRNDDF